MKRTNGHQTRSLKRSGRLELKGSKSRLLHQALFHKARIKDMAWVPWSSTLEFQLRIRIVGDCDPSLAPISVEMLCSRFASDEPKAEVALGLTDEQGKSSYASLAIYIYIKECLGNGP